MSLSQWRAIAECARNPLAGVENVAALLHALVLMHRPGRILEIGAGYTTFFLAAGAAEVDAQCLLEAEERPLAHPNLLTDGLSSCIPHVHVLDDGSELVLPIDALTSALAEAELLPYISLHQRDFRGFGMEMLAHGQTFDLIWFDCGGPREYEDFLVEFWPILSAGSGLMVLHFTEVEMQVQTDDGVRMVIVPSPILNLIRRASRSDLADAAFEMTCTPDWYRSEVESFALMADG